MAVRWPAFCLVAPCVAALAGCSGAVGGSGSSGNPGGKDHPQGGDTGSEDGTDTVPPGQVPDADRCSELGNAKVPPAVATMRRLSWQEIANAWTDLFAVPLGNDLATQTETASLPLRTEPNLEINETFVRAYRPALEAYAGRVARAVTTTGACKAIALPCLQAELLKSARRAWRHTLTAEETTFLNGKLAAFTAEIGMAEGFSAALQLMLASPRFLFLPDVGVLEGDVAEGKIFTASDDRLVGLWAAAVWASVPDEALLNDSAAGVLKSSEGRAVALARMLSDPKAKRGLTSFFRGWFGHNQIIKAIKDEKEFAAFDDVVRQEMLTDTETTLSELVFDEKASPNALLSSSLGTPGAKTVALLGWGKSNIEAKRQDLQKTGRRGIATHPAVLAITSKAAATSIVNRGRFVVEKLACGHVPEPPKDLNIDEDKLAEQASRLTGRQVAEQHAADPVCGGCHRFMDPFGVAFENFDPIGRQRTTDNNQPIDTSVEVKDALGINGKFSGASELLQALEATGRTEHCFVTNFAGFVMPQPWSEAQSCALGSFVEHQQGSTPPMLDIVKAFLLSDLFIQRSSTAL